MSGILHVLTLSCPDRPGIVSRVTGELFEAGGNIREANHFEDGETGTYFMRLLLSLRGEDDLSGCCQANANPYVRFQVPWPRPAASFPPTQQSTTPSISSVT